MYYDGVIIKPTLNELYHHGIKGQKWGVKNGPPYPIGRKQRVTNRGIPKIDDRHYIPKGTKMYRVTTSPNEVNKGSTYVTYDSRDRDYYISYIYQQNRDSDVYLQTFTTSEDIKIPSQKEYQEILLEKVWNNKELRDMAINGFVDFRSYKTYQKDKISKMKDDYDELLTLANDSSGKNLNPLSTYFYITNSKDMDTYAKNYNEGLYDIYAYDAVSGEDYILKKSVIEKEALEYDKKMTNFDRYAEGSLIKENTLKQVADQKFTKFGIMTSSLGVSKEIREAISEELQSRGFNAVVDEAGVGTYEVPGRTEVSREGFETLIILDRAQSLVPTEIKKVTREDYDRAMDTYDKNYNDYNKKRKITWS